MHISSFLKATRNSSRCSGFERFVFSVSMSINQTMYLYCIEVIIRLLNFIL
jgi:hypothetical protein